ncbi:hypothetical protein JTB14_018851 [Gonioctena quinquepunctata]|nr:hypothetical protein JTB14_018851 [Gonioctena quinquepunctata]
MKFILIAVGFLVILADCRVPDEVLENFLSEIPEREKIQFLRYALFKGYYSSGHHQNLGPPPRTPKLFSDLYNYYSENHRVDDARPEQYNPYKKICFPSVGCLILNDGGVYPFVMAENQTSNMNEDALL